ncbi:MAG: DNA/RNA non-specific endonuclease [Cyanobacteria bacterium P01_D01_bin.71]
MGYRFLRVGIIGFGICWLAGCGLLPTTIESSLVEQSDRSALPPCVDDDCNCRDFRDQALAQTVLTAFPDDPFQLDRDGSGTACEALPLAALPPDPAVPPSPNPHLILGNPSNAGGGNLDNYLLERSQYALSYSHDRGTANWVSWQLSADWLGDTPRQDNFRQDGGLPTGVYQVTPNDYRNSGYDRGHIVPSGDRTRSVGDNAATFLMTNILPQAPDNNRGVWRELEEYSRDWVYQFDRTLLIIAGGYGEQTRLAAGQVIVPSRLWKIIVILEPGQAPSDIDENTLVMAIDLPNRNNIQADWRAYQTTVDRIELATGYDFLTAVPVPIQEILEAQAVDLETIRTP